MHNTTRPQTVVIVVATGTSLAAGLIAELGTNMSAKQMVTSKGGIVLIVLGDVVVMTF